MGRRPLPATRARSPLIARACAKTWPGTIEAVEAVVTGSVGVPMWTPARAVALMALDPAPAGHVWMTTEEFAKLSERMGGVKGRAALVRQELAMPKTRRLAILRGERITKVEAMACAHWAAALPMPVAPGDVPAFQAWVAREFGLTNTLGAALDVHTAVIRERMRGYALHAGRRVARLPEAGLIRALDWCRRVGPFSPYGDRLGPHPFPQGAPDAS